MGGIENGWRCSQLSDPDQATGQESVRSWSSDMRAQHALSIFFARALDCFTAAMAVGLREMIFALYTMTEKENMFITQVRRVAQTKILRWSKYSTSIDNIMGGFLSICAQQNTCASISTVIVAHPEHFLFTGSVLLHFLAVKLKQVVWFCT